MSIDTGEPTQDAPKPESNAPVLTVSQSARAARAKIDQEMKDKAALVAALALWAQLACGDVRLPVHLPAPLWRRVAHGWRCFLSAFGGPAADPLVYDVVDVAPRVIRGPCKVEVVWGLPRLRWPDCDQYGINFGLTLDLRPGRDNGRLEESLHKNVADHLQAMLACRC